MVSAPVPAARASTSRSVGSTTGTSSNSSGRWNSNSSSLKPKARGCLATSAQAISFGT